MSGERTLSARPRPKPPQPEQRARPQNLQDAFLNLLRKNKSPVTMFLVKGVKLQGIVTWFDNFSILLRRDGQSQLVYKHAISTIMPAQPVVAQSLADQQRPNKKSKTVNLDSSGSPQWTKGHRKVDPLADEAEMNKRKKVLRHFFLPLLVRNLEHSSLAAEYQQASEDGCVEDWEVGWIESMSFLFGAEGLAR